MRGAVCQVSKSQRGQNDGAANLSLKVVWGTCGGGGERRCSKGAFFLLSLSLLLFDNFFPQKYHFNQSSDNYETCQLIAKIHQTRHR